MGTRTGGAGATGSRATTFPGLPGAAILALLVPLAPLPGGPGALGAQEYHVVPDAPRSVVFTSETTLDEFQGVTDRIDGYVLLDGGGVRASEEVEGELYFEVDLASMDTGISLRNRHMRDNYLHTDDHPYATFEARIRAITRAAPGEFRVDARGTFTVHGVARERTIPCGLTAVGGDSAWDVSCAFPVALEDHDIEIPRIMFMKLAPEVRLDLSFRVRQVE